MLKISQQVFEKSCLEHNLNKNILEKKFEVLNTGGYFSIKYVSKDPIKTKVINKLAIFDVSSKYTGLNNYIEVMLKSFNPFKNIITYIDCNHPSKNLKIIELMDNLDKSSISSDLKQSIKKLLMSFLYK